MHSLTNIIICFIIIVNVSTSNVCAKTLHDLPWSIDKGNFIISAKLYQSNYQSSYDIREYIYSDEDIIRGKISITSMNNGSKLDIFYSDHFKNDRIVIRDNDCRQYTFNKFWNEELFDTGWTNALLNQVLMTGPSILLRLYGKNLIWKQEPDTEIRGFSAHCARASVHEDLDILSYYKAHLSLSSVLLETSRLRFIGYESSLPMSTKEDFYVDYFTIEETDAEISKLITVTPGLGCPTSLIDHISDTYETSPSLMESEFHFFSKVYVDGPEKSITQNEFYVKTRSSVARLRSTSNGITTETLYNYRLGLQYVSKQGLCTVSSMGLDSPGISEYRGLYAPQVFYYDSWSCIYFGKVYHQYGSNYEAHVWEMTEYNYRLNGKPYDKLVKTHYFVKAPGAELFGDYILVRTTLNGFNKTSTGSFKLIETTRIDYYDLEKISQGIDYEAQLFMRFDDCYPDPNDRKTIAIHLDCEEENNKANGNKNCIPFAESHYNSFIGNIKSEIEAIDISRARIANVNLIFQEEEIILYITFLTVPEIKNSLSFITMYVSKNTITRSERLQAKSENDCLSQQALVNTDIAAIIYCEKSSDSNICGRFASKESIEKDPNDGTFCKVYFPLVGFENYAREIPLEKLEEYLNKKKITLQMFSDKFGVFDFKSIQARDVSDQSDSKNAPFEVSDRRKKLSETNVNVEQINGVSNLQDCYRACSHSDNVCETFVYCQHSDTMSCLTSYIPYQQLSSESIYDTSCTIYSKNRLSDFVKIKSKAYKHPFSIAVDASVEDCASLCSTSDDCLSFQHCGSSCTFGGYYTDSLAKTNERCDIYIPKVSQNFHSTGRKVISDVFHTEFNLNLDQCAALCHDWINNDEHCQSFNYCHKSDGSRSCSLTKYSVGDATVNKADSNECLNYELLQQSVKKQRNPVNNQLDKASISGRATFGLIILFVTTGLLIGFAVPYFGKLFSLITRKRFSTPASSSLGKESNSFKWSRQVDVHDEDQRSVI